MALNQGVFGRFVGSGREILERKRHKTVDGSKFVLVALRHGYRLDALEPDPATGRLRRIGSAHYDCIDYAREVARVLALHSGFLVDDQTLEPKA